MASWKMAFATTQPYYRPCVPQLGGRPPWSMGLSGQLGLMPSCQEHVIMPGVHMSEEIKKSGPDAGDFGFLYCTVGSKQVAVDCRSPI